MLSYKGARCWYLGPGQWRIYYDGADFRLCCRSGVKELLAHIDRWRSI